MSSVKQHQKHKGKETPDNPPAHHEPRKDGPRHGSHRRVPEVLAVHVQVVADDRDEGRRRKGGKLGHEERDPREVEGAHVWLGQAEELDLAGLQIKFGMWLSELLCWQFEVGLSVPLSVWNWNEVI